MWTYFTMLHVDYFFIIGVNELEVLYWGKIHALVKIKAKCLNLIVPTRGFIKQFYYIFRIVICIFTLDCLRIFCRVSPKYSFCSSTDHWCKDSHLPWSFRTKKIWFILDYSHLLPYIINYFSFLRSFLAVVYIKLGS